MIDYLLCTLFWFVFTVILVVLGRAVNNGKQTLSADLITGYCVYSVAIAAGGIILQLINVKWMIFAFYVLILWLAIFIFIIIKGKKNPSIFKIDFKLYIKNNWILYAVCMVLIIMLCCGYAGFWLGNHQDDGYYITKVADLSYGRIGANINYALGNQQKGFNAYIVNTWESEASVYVKILGVQVTLFLRFFQSIFNYFLLVNLIKAFADRLKSCLKISINPNMTQYTSIIVLLFGMYYIFLSDTCIFGLRDMFHFNSGMFLGVSVVKTMSIMFYLLFYLEKEKISWKMMLGAALISILLMSKSTIALPVIVISLVSAGLVWLFLGYGKIGKLVSILLLEIYCLIGILLPNNVSIQEVVQLDVSAVLKSPIIVACIIVFLLTFFLKERVVYKLNLFIVLCACFALVPQVNDIYEALSVYAFVGGRGVTTFLYFFVMVSFFYLIVILKKYNVRDMLVKSGYLLFAFCEIIVMFWGFHEYGGNLLPGNPKTATSIRGCLGVIKHNIYFMPDSTIELGEKINLLSQESDEQLRVITPKMLLMDGALHTPAIMMRIYAPNIISLSAAERYPANDGSVMEEYKQQNYDAFVAAPSDETAKEFFEEIDNLGVNCIAVQNAQCAEWLEERGYSLYDTTVKGSYFIWYRRSGGRARM